MTSVLEICQQAKTASHALSKSTSQQRNQVLLTLVDILQNRQARILEQNLADCEEVRSKGLNPALLERLKLDEKRIAAMADGVQVVAALPDPLDQRCGQKELPNGLHIYKQHVPLGVLAVIYESRPNVTIDVAALAIKSGNAVILRGGKETLRTNAVLVDCVQTAMQKIDIPSAAVQFINDPDHSLVEELLGMYPYVDMLIPRGGADLHRYCREHSRIPVITGGIGICHLFIDESADQSRALEVIANAKIQRPTVCNALDTVIVHERIAAAFLSLLINRMKKEKVTLHIPSDLLQILMIDSWEYIQQISEGDYDKEWLSLDLSVKVVRNVDEAITFIGKHSTGHSDGILTENDANAAHFLRMVDSSVVYVNASTRFTDGAELGLGAEVAISTQRLHARGPMALQELTTYKWVVKGNYHTRV